MDQTQIIIKAEKGSHTFQEEVKRSVKLRMSFIEKTNIKKAQMINLQLHFK